MESAAPKGQGRERKGVVCPLAEKARGTFGTFGGLGSECGLRVCVSANCPCGGSERGRAGSITVGNRPKLRIRKLSQRCSG